MPSELLDNNNKNTHLSQLSWGNLYDAAFGNIRAERTPGEVAASGHTVGANGLLDNSFAPNFTGVPQTNALPAPAGANLKHVPSLSRTLPLPYTLIKKTIYNFNVLKSLLRPRHKYFEDKQAFITELSVYRLRQGEEGALLYPKIKGTSSFSTRQNPYRKYQLSRKHSGETISKIKNVIDKAKLKDFRLACLVLTVPHVLSVELAGRGESGRNIMWSCFKKFLVEDLPGIVGVPEGKLGCEANLHIWQTGNPLVPHFHLHAIVPNYLFIDSSHFVDEEGKSAQEFKKWFGTDIVRKYTANKKIGLVRRGPVPFSDIELLAVKVAWTKRLRASCKRNSIKCEYFNDPEALADIFVDFVSWDDKNGRGRFMHKVNYQRRHWSEDYCKYTEEHLDCSNPPVWLENYRNKARPFGWWTQLSTLGRVVKGEGEEEEKEKLSPFDGEKMLYDGVTTIYSLLQRPEGVAAVEMYKGRPVFRDLTVDDLIWLKGSQVTHYGTAEVEGSE
jgi:hypothetical protein